MSAPTEQRSVENKAAVGFMVVMALLAGGAGVLVAAAAVGLQRAWSGMEPRSRGEGWRRSVADHRAWLDMDRKARDEWRAERQAWWRDGADPAKRPVQDPAGKRVGAWLRRTWARTVVTSDRSGGAVGRFWRGAREGWRAADEVRRDGGGFRDIAKARPSTPTPGSEQPPTLRRDEPAEYPDVTSSARAEWSRLYGEMRKAWNRRDWMSVIATLDEMKRRYPSLYDMVLAQHVDPETEQPRGAMKLDQLHEQARRNLRNDPDHAGLADDPPDHVIDELASDEHQGVVDAINGTSTEDTMTAPTTSTPARSTVPAGETHLDLTDAGLADVKGTLAQISETVDILAQLRSTLAGQVSALNERVTANGGTAETTQSLDAAMSVINQIGDQVGRLSESAVEAADVTDAAQAGLAPARDAQDALHAAGGRGDFVATAHSD